MTKLIEMNGISKAFGASHALKNVSLALMGGSVHALMGENGAGKSTLMKILAGVHRPDGGKILKNGKAVSFGNPKEALDLGISTVFQELSLLPNLSIGENMFLGREPVTSLGVIDYAKINRDTKAALKELGLALDPNTLVSELSIAQRQFVEIAHGIKADADVFILDEPTAALNAADVNMLNKHIRRLREEGKAIVYISHRMDEIFEICDTVTVLKDGELVGTHRLSQMTQDKLIAMMVGRELEDLFPERAEAVGPARIEITDFCITPDSQPLSMKVGQGEIVALAGLEGQGQQKLLRSLVGQYAPHRGHVSIDGKALNLPLGKNTGIRTLQSIGVGFIPEDRKEEGLFLSLSIAHNIAMVMHSAKQAFSVAERYRQKILETMSSMSVRANGPADAVGALSGGNQQKVLLGRYLVADMKILLVEEPTRGVDIGAKSEIYQLLRDFARRGGAVIVLSRETIELIGLCDRIYVVHDDTIVSEMAAEQASEHEILNAALSRKQDRSIGREIEE